LGTTIRGVDLGGQLLVPCWPVARRLPSKVNALVTMPTVRGADLAARRATTGAAPEPCRRRADGDEDHVGALQQALDLVLLPKADGGRTRGRRPAPEAARLLFADVDVDVGDAELCELSGRC